MRHSEQEAVEGASLPLKIVALSFTLCSKNQLRGARHRQERPPYRKQRAFTNAACMTWLRLTMHCFLKRFEHAAQCAGAVEGASLPLQNRCTLIHTVEDISFEVHAIGKSEHPTGSCVG